MDAVASSGSSDPRSFDGSATRSASSVAGSAGSATSSAPFFSETIPVRRTKSLSDLRTREPAPKLHRLQRIPRRSSFDDASRPAPDWPGQLLTGYDEDGIHSCSHCQKITIDLRLTIRVPRITKSALSSKKSNPAHRVGDLGVTYTQAKKAAEEGCLFFLSLGPDIDPRLNVEDIAKSRNWYSKLPEPMLDRPIAYLLLETGYPYSQSELSVILYFDDCFDDGDYINEYNRVWVLHTLDESQLLPQSSRCRQELHMHSTGLHWASRDWITTCNKEHLECSNYRRDFTPLRLLRVWCDDIHDKVTLTSPQEPAQYTTLSYCWGGDQRFKTTSKTIASAQNGLPLEVLPETIQDAIRVTRDLGVANLWVDSLCIVQDDEAEMLDQISQMAQIFEGSYLTIAASQSPRSSDRFLSMPNPFGLVCKVTVTRADGSKDAASIGKCSAHPLDHMSLVSRAWTLQETLLSPRILSFEYGHLHWYCPTFAFGICSCMIFRTTDPRLGFDPGFTLTRFENKHTNSSKHRMSALMPQKIQRFPYLRSRKVYNKSEWQWLVEMYSKRRLTYDADKLLAISAVAERFEKLENWGRYMAGMWEKDLLQQCIWTIRWGSTQRSFARLSHVPSWSWASVSAEITWMLSGQILERWTKPSCCIIHAEVELKSEKAPFGDVVGGRLILKGRLKKAFCKWDAGCELAYLFELLNEDPLTTGIFVWRFELDLLKDKSGSMVVSCLEVAPLHVGDYGRGKLYAAIAMVLAHDERTDTYQRVGCYIKIKLVADMDTERKRALQAWWSKGWKTQTVTIV